MPDIPKTSTAAIGLALLMAMAPTASAVEWDMPSHYPAGNFHVEGMQPSPTR